MMLYLLGLGFSDSDIAEALVQWRGGESASRLREVTYFQRACRGLTDYFRGRLGPSAGREDIDCFWAQLDAKAVCDPYRMTRDDAPSHVMWIVSDTCRARCIYCFQGPDKPAKFSARGREKLSRDRIVQLLQELHELGCPDVTFTGGDPFCRADMFDILEAAIPLEWPALTVVTKCVLSREQLRRLRRIGSIIWSIDSCDDLCVERLTGVPGLATRMLSCIEEATQLSIPVKVNITVTQLNVEGIPHLVEELVRRGVQDIAAKDYIPEEGTPVELLSLFPEQKGRLARELRKLSAIYASKARIAYKDISPAQHERALLNAYRESLRRNTPAMMACKSGYSEMTIGLDGSVLLCEQMPEPVFGTVAAQSIQEVWDTCYIQEVGNDSHRRHLCADECQSCPVFDECGYRTTCYSRTRTYKGALYGAAEPGACSYRRAVRRYHEQPEEKKRTDVSLSERSH